VATVTPILYPYDGDDAAADWRPVVMEDDHAPGFDEWNALRLSQGQRLGSFTEYMREIAPLLAQERRINCD
jgi:hypothetical protein